MANWAERGGTPVRYGEIPGLGPCSRLVLGTLTLSADRQREADALLDAFLDLGGNAVDTALVYGGGASERAVGTWLRDRGVRSRVLLIDKGAHPDARGPRVHPDAIAEDLSRNLEHLGVDRIDLFMLHRDDPAIPVGVLIEALNVHRRAGRIREFAGSNWTAERLEAANRYAEEAGLRGFVASSPNLSLAVPREPRWPGCVFASQEERAWYRARQFPLLAWSAQAGGFFTDRCAPGRPLEREMARVYDTPDNWERRARAERLAARYGATANQVALAWVLAQDFPTFAIVGPQTVEELRSSAEALDLELTPEEVRWLDLQDREDEERPA
jgi:aryl-alcohol dehydrogenase-like predicted oxidoreductase